MSQSIIFNEKPGKVECLASGPMDITWSHEYHTGQIVSLTLKDSASCSFVSQFSTVLVSLDQDSSFVDRGKDNLVVFTPLHTDPVCVACMEWKADVSTLPCGHTALCQICFQEWPNNCPLCRSPVKRIKWIYWYWCSRMHFVSAKKLKMDMGRPSKPYSTLKSSHPLTTVATQRIVATTGAHTTFKERFTIIQWNGSHNTERKIPNVVPTRSAPSPTIHARPLRTPYMMALPNQKSPTNHKGTPHGRERRYLCSFRLTS